MYCYLHSLIQVKLYVLSLFADGNISRLTEGEQRFVSRGVEVSCQHTDFNGQQ